MSDNENVRWLSNIGEKLIAGVSWQIGEDTVYTCKICKKCKSKFEFNGNEELEKSHRMQSGLKGDMDLCKYCDESSTFGDSIPSYNRYIPLPYSFTRNTGDLKKSS